MWVRVGFYDCKSLGAGPRLHQRRALPYLPPLDSLDYFMGTEPSGSVRPVRPENMDLARLRSKRTAQELARYEEKRHGNNTHTYIDIVNNIYIYVYIQNRCLHHIDIWI